MADVELILFSNQFFEYEKTWCIESRISLSILPIQMEKNVI